jgi:G:T-mismatch repair DNA endonuclease (very short patch repair protein)
MDANWRVLVFWECAIRGKSETHCEAVLDEAASWIREGASTLKVLPVTARSTGDE